MENLASMAFLEKQQKKEAKVVVEIDLSHACIEKTGACLLANSLMEPRMAKLQVLQLSNNYTGPEGVFWLAAALQDHPALRVLGLAWNRVDDPGAIRIAIMTEKVKTLKELYLNFNRITDPGAERLARCITGSKSKVRMLDLSHNQIEARGAKKLRAAARKAIELRLEGNPSDREPIYMECPVHVGPGPGGLVLPQIQGITVAGWPRTITTPAPRARKNDMMDDHARPLTGFEGQPTVPGYYRRICGTASALSKFGPSPWPASMQLRTTLSETKFESMHPSRVWSRGAHMRHTSSNLGDTDHFPSPKKKHGMRSTMSTFASTGMSSRTELSDYVPTGYVA